VARSVADRAGAASVPVAPVLPTATPIVIVKEVIATPVPAPPTKPPVVEAPAVSEDQQIRDAVRRFAQAYSTFDVETYVRLLPSAASKRDSIRKSFDQMASQQLQIDILSIDRLGNEATVRASERRVLTPRWARH
jgi:hypothetical protein